MHVAKDQIGKLDPKSRLCIYLGYDKDEFSYWLWDLINKKVIRSRDIVFMEENTIADWETKKSGSSSHPTGREQLDKIDNLPVGSQMLAEAQSGLVESRRGIGLAERNSEADSRQRSELDLDLELVEEDADRVER